MDDQNLERYAEVILKVGLNLQPGQRLLIGAPTALTPLETAPLVRLVTEKAYQMGARLVDVLWGDDQLKLARVKYAAEDTLEEFPTWQMEASKDIVQRGDARLIIHVDDPALFKNQDQERVGKLQQIMVKTLQPLIEMNPSYNTNWVVIAAPIPGWSASIFPGLPPDEQQAKMWETIFKICRIDRPDPVSAWRRHLAELKQRHERLAQKQYTGLRLRGPGTDLRLGLPHGHIWHGGQLRNRAGIEFTPNLPTEEVFTLPHRLYTEGMVTATRPFSFGGGVIEGAKLTFKEGQVVEFSATDGEAVLRSVVESDEGARMLGEVALVPHSSPISQSGLVFNNILFDENASCHLAFGYSFSASLRGGVDMSKEEFRAAGGNTSNVHLDFMVGSGELDVDGLCADGTVEAVMRSGEWVD